VAVEWAVSLPRLDDTTVSAIARRLGVTPARDREQCSRFGAMIRSLIIVESSALLLDQMIPAPRVSFESGAL
jgi:hypothetical protein